MFVNINTIVGNVKTDLGIENETLDYRIIHFAVQGVKRLTLAGLTTLKATWLDVTDIKTVNLPEDFVSLIRIGITCGEHLQFLTQTKPLLKALKLDNCGQEERVEGCCDKQNHNFRNTFGWYELDLKNGRIILENGIKEDQIYIEYISDGVLSDGNTLVPSFGERALTAYVHLEMATNIPNYQPMYGMRENNFKKEKLMLNRVMNGFSVADVLEVINNNRKLFKP